MILEVALTNKFEEIAWVYGHLNKFYEVSV